VIEVPARAGGERACVALLPFCSQRYVVRATELLAGDAASNAGDYAARMQALLHALSGEFSADTVNVVVAHCMARGGKLGGGERDAQTIEPYWVSGTAFPSAHYVALGHLHLTQEIPGAAPVWYSGSPIQVDFGEAGAGKHVLVVDAAPGRPAKIERVALTTGEQLRTLEGTFADVEAFAASEDLSAAWLRVRITEPARAGLNEDVRALLGDRVVEVRARGSGDPQVRAEPGRAGRSPQQLFASYLEEQEIADDRLVALFAELLDEELAR
jgi:exonuclease SbcD